MPNRVLLTAGRRAGFFILLVLAATLTGRAQQPTFKPGGDVYDTAGNLVQAVEGGILQVGSLYYLWGMDRSQNNYPFRAVNLYSSSDLKTWTFVNQILKSTSHPDLDNNAVVERPKLLYNASTGQFVLWMHYEGLNAYRTAEVAYATCATIGGNYTFQSHFRPLGFDSRDMNTYVDTDGTAYLISSIATNSQVSIMQLNAAYTAPVQEVFRGYGSAGIGCEGHAIIKKDGVYFWIQSLCSGWETNDNRYYTATSLAGPWTSRGNIAPSGARTFQTQVTYAFPITGSNGTIFAYMGDRWVPSNFSMSRLVILPLSVSGTTLSLNWYDQWNVFPATGTGQALPATTWGGTYRLVNRNSGKVLGVAGAAATSGALVTQQTANNSASQLWSIQNVGGGEYRFDNAGSGLSLEIGGSSRTVGAPTQQYTWNGGFNQRWHVLACGGGYYRLTNVNTLGKTIEVVNSSTADGASVGLNNFFYTDNQEWSFVPTVLATTAPQLTDEEFAAFPNPLAAEGTFRVVLAQPGPVCVRVYQAGTGALVRELNYERLPAGTHLLRWPTGELPAGLYLYQATAAGRQQTGKLTRLY